MADGNVPTVTNDSDIANVFRSHHGIRASKDLRMYKFDGKDYHLWSFAMKGYLRSQGLWGVVSGAMKKPVFPLAAPTLAELAVLDTLEANMATDLYNRLAAILINTPAADLIEVQKQISNAFEETESDAMTVISFCVDKTHMQLITSCANSHEAWIKLRTRYYEDSLPNQMRLEDEYKALKMSRGMTIENYISRSDAYVDRLRGVGIIITDNQRILNLLRGLSPQYEFVKITCADTR